MRQILNCAHSTGKGVPEWEKSVVRNGKRKMPVLNKKLRKPNLQKGSRRSPKCKQTKIRLVRVQAHQQQQLQGFPRSTHTNKYLGSVGFVLWSTYWFWNMNLLHLKKYICLKNKIGNNLFLLQYLNQGLL